MLARLPGPAPEPFGPARLEGVGGVVDALLGTAVATYLAWRTVEIRSTQSATGILYVDFFTVIVGEVLAKYVLLSTKVPV